MTGKKKEAWTVAIFFVDRLFGGREEGGWWYNAGHPSEEPEHIAMMRVFKKKEAAIRHRERLRQSVLPDLNEGRRSIDSVLSEGVFEVLISEGLPKPFPSHRPRYE
jgi:hypothetical protein